MSLKAGLLNQAAQGMARSEAAKPTIVGEVAGEGILLTAGVIQSGSATEGYVVAAYDLNTQTEGDNIEIASGTDAKIFGLPGAAELSADDQVWLAWFPNQQLPVIL